MRSMSLVAPALLSLASFAGEALAWNAHGHRTITYVALEGFGSAAPEWLRDPAVRHQIAYQASEADRWRGTRAPALGHVNSPDHYIDLDVLGQFGLTVETIPPLRNEYLRAMAIAKHEHPENVDPYDVSRDRDRSKEWPGFLPHAITEQYAKLVSSFNTVRILEAVDEPSRVHQLAQARANAVYHMGMLSHFVGDAAQPLHTTVHHHGWIGENPDGYSTDYGIHAYIDGGVVDHHGIIYSTLLPGARFDRQVNGADPWRDAIEHIERSFAHVETVYKLEKSGELREDAGKAFIVERLTDGATMLAAMYSAAYEAAAPTDGQIINFIKYDELKAETLPE